MLLDEEFVCWELNMNVFDVENPPLVVDDLSTNWNCKDVGGDDLPVVGVTRRMDDGVAVVVVVVVACLKDDPRVLVELSECVSAMKRERESRMMARSTSQSQGTSDTYEEIVS